jgi:hypothetical protein
MSRSVADRLKALDVKGNFESRAERVVRAETAAAAKRAGEGPQPTAPPRSPQPAVTQATDGRPGRGRPPRHEEPTQQTTVRLTRGEWAALQAQVMKETVERGERRYVVDIIRDAIADYLARRG